MFQKNLQMCINVSFYEVGKKVKEKVLALKVGSQFYLSC